MQHRLEAPQIELRLPALAVEASRSYPSDTPRRPRICPPAIAFLPSIARWAVNRRLKNGFALGELRSVRLPRARSQACAVDTPRFGDAVSGPISSKQTAQ